jgi:hypothetical protein
VNGKGTDKKGYRVWDSYGRTYYLALSLEDSDDLDIPWNYFRRGKVLDAKVNDSGFYVDGKLVGLLGQRPPQMDVRNPNPATDGKINYYAGPITTKKAVKTAVIDGEKVKVAYLNNDYFTFSLRP